MIISSFIPIRSALVNLQRENLIQTIEEDLIRWAMEAEAKINTGSWLEQKSVCLHTSNNQVCLPTDYKMLVCMKVNAIYPTIINRVQCRCVDACLNLTSCAIDIQAKIGQKTITFMPTQDDNVPVYLDYMALAVEEETGYPMIDEDHAYAVSLFIQKQILYRDNDLSRYNITDGEWKLACGQARAATNSKLLTQDQLNEIGYVWYNNASTY
jgi:hypothetical protein